MVVIPKNEGVLEEDVLDHLAPYAADSTETENHRDPCLGPIVLVPVRAGFTPDVDTVAWKYEPAVEGFRKVVQTRIIQCHENRALEQAKMLENPVQQFFW